MQLHARPLANATRRTPLGGWRPVDRVRSNSLGARSVGEIAGLVTLVKTLWAQASSGEPGSPFLRVVSPSQFLDDLIPASRTGRRQLLFGPRGSAMTSTATSTRRRAATGIREAGARARPGGATMAYDIVLSRSCGARMAIDGFASGLSAEAAQLRASRGPAYRRGAFAPRPAPSVSHVRDGDEDPATIARVCKSQLVPGRARGLSPTSPPRRRKVGSIATLRSL